MEARLNGALHLYGQMAQAGQREGQVHLLLSRSELTAGDYGRMLRNGAEFDRQVAAHLLGQEGLKLIAQYGEYRILKFGIAGRLAVEAANSFGGFERSRTVESIPNPVRQFLSSWCVRQARPRSEVRAQHCSMMFREPVPVCWLEGVETLAGPPPSPK